MTIFGNEINIYSGTGSLSGVTLSGAAAGSYTTNYGGSFTFYSSTDGDGDGDEDYLEFSFTGSLSDSISGTYGPDTDDSNNVFAGQTGTFTATKN
ncbi:MAG: hypothetical protein JXA95_10935 [Spirochaetales bacterium]|nr:hypothetical protein [Spirochaetales bacterium]